MANRFVKFGNRLSRALKRTGLSNYRVAKEIGIVPSAIANYKKGQIPNAMTLLKLSKLLGVSSEWLLTGTDLSISPIYSQDKHDLAWIPVVNNFRYFASLPKSVSECTVGYELVSGIDIPDSFIINEVAFKNDQHPSDRNKIIVAPVSQLNEGEFGCLIVKNDPLLKIGYIFPNENFHILVPFIKFKKPEIIANKRVVVILKIFRIIKDFINIKTKKYKKL